ncbi:tetratricopeptide repeat protein [Limibacter armeniacum]|uniref:tetratricopeptide repeat protein n=1 Tax=Limibacter armeniacum TaxID=466084 RepID=UPI002FE61B7D
MLGFIVAILLQIVPTESFQSNITVKGSPSDTGTVVSYAWRDTTEIIELYEKAEEMYRVDPELSKRIGSKVLSFSESRQWYRGIAIGYFLIAKGYYGESYYRRSASVYRKALRAALVSGDQELEANIKNYLGSAERVVGKHEEAINYHLEALTYFDKVENKKGILESYRNIGHINYVRKNYQDAYRYYQNALEIANEIGYVPLKSSVLYSLSSTNVKMGKYDEGIKQLNMSIAIDSSQNNKRGLCWSLYKKGVALRMKKQYTDAVTYLTKAREISEELLLNRVISATYVEEGRCYFDLEKYAMADEMFKQGLDLALAISDVELLQDVYEQLYIEHEQIKDYPKALHYLKELRSLSDSIYNGQKEEIIKTLETEYGTAIRERENQELKAQNEQQTSVIYWQKIVVFIIGVSLLTVLVLVFVLFRANSFRHTANMNLKSVNENLHNKQMELLARQEELKEATRVLKQKNEDITDSITYASKIQKALLPLEERINSSIPEHFILSRPLHIVSGDFYWFHVVKQGDEELTFLAVGDCTGHGVPGAFMSVLGNSILRETVIQRKIYEPEKILLSLKDALYAHLKPDATLNHDGMELALCLVRKKAKVLEFASSGLPLLYFQNGQMHRIKGDKSKVEGRFNKTGHYKSFKIPYELPLTFYMYTDGYQDQFGGKRNKKFLSKRFRGLLEQIQDLNMSEQSELLIKMHESWKGNEPQTDDILVLGARLS